MSFGGSTYWTDEKVELLRSLFTERLSASKIASRMGEGVTRNMVIGKLSRMGLSLEKTTISEETRQARLLARNQRRAAAENMRYYARTGKTMTEAPSTIAALPEYAGSLRIPFADLRDFKNNEPNQCRYIADEPPGPDYLACGNETRDGGSYCQHCWQMLRPRAQMSSEERTVATALRVRNYQRSQGRAA